MPLARFFPTAARKTKALPSIARFAAAAAIVIGVTLFRDLASGPLHLPKVPLLTYILPVLVVTSFFGRGPGLLAVILSAGIVAFRYLGPMNAIMVDDPSERAAILMFVCVGSLVTITIASMQDAMARLEASEQRRGLLLTEFRHRSRNDLASLSSLLLLRARESSPETRDTLKKAADHAFALARIHTHLAAAMPSTEDGAVISTGTFVPSLLRETIYGKPGVGEMVTLRLLVEDHTLTTERAVQLGIVLHKAVSNALRYGRSDGRPLMIDVSLTRKDGYYDLSIIDDGVGMPERRLPSFGDRMLQSLAAQLRGEFARSSQPDAGTSCDLRFPADVETTRKG